MSAVSIQLVQPCETELSASARALVREYLTSVHGDLDACRMREQDAALLLDMASVRESPVVVAVHPEEGPVGVTVLHRYEGHNELRAAYVRARHRGRGLLWAMTRALLDHAAARDIEPVFAVVAVDGPLESAFGRWGLSPSGPPPDGAPGYVRYDIPVRHRPSRLDAPHQVSTGCLTRS